MAAVMPRALGALELNRHILHGALIFYLCYILLSDLKHPSSSEDNCSAILYIGKKISASQFPNSVVPRRANSKSVSLQASTQFIMIGKIVQYSSLAILVLLAGDIEPNPGWSYPALNRPGLKIAQLNIRSLPKHLDELKILLHDNPFDVVCINETWLNSSWTDSELNIEGYNLIRFDRPSSQRGGGTAIYYNSKLTAHHRQDLSCNDMEAVWLEIMFPNKSKALVCSIYQPPNGEFKNFKSTLDKTLEQISTEGKEIIILGDFNCDMLPKRLASDAKELRGLFNLYQFNQLIQSPTRITDRTATLIDLAYTTEKEKIVSSGVLDCAISDHSLVFIIRRAKKPRVGVKNIIYRNFKNYTAEQFSNDLHSASWEDIDISLTIEEAWEAFKTTLNSTMDKHAPLSMRRARANTLPWLTGEIRKTMLERDHHHKKAQKTGSLCEWATYRRLRNQTTNLIRESKRNYYSNLINENKKDSSKLWKTLKSVISSNKKSSNIGCLETNDGLVYDSKEISQGFAQYFHTAITKIRQSLSSSLAHRRSSISLIENSFRFSKISPDFVCSELKKIKANKSTGLVNTPARLLKDGCGALAKPLTALMNRSLAEGAIPTDWKHATVTPIFKSGSKTDPSNYRPISVLPVFCKIFERAIHLMVYEYLQKNKLLSVYQSGFRPLHSTATCLTDVTNTLLYNIDKGLMTGMVFLDLSKAFDTLDHTHLLRKLSRLGFTSSSVQWFNAYLSNRTQSIVVDGELSETQSVLFGVPQGSILGPLLFIMYINDLPAIVKYCNIQLYADDTLLYFSCKYVDTIETKLSEDLDQIISWLSSNYLFLNYKKTKVMLIGTAQRLRLTSSFTIKANDKVFDRVFSFKYLGVVLDPCLSWNDHIDHIASKISSRLGMLRKARKVIPRDACITLYNSMVLPLFDYCSCVWDGCSNTRKEYLDRLQRRAAAIIEGRKISQNELHLTFSWPSLQARRNFQNCMLVYKCLNNLAPAYLLNEFRFSRQFHHYDTRNKDLLRLPLAKTAKYQSSFRYIGAKTWNSLPANIRNISALLPFKQALKSFFRN